MVFTGHDHIEGFEYVLNVLNKQKRKDHSFFTGDFVSGNNEALVTRYCKKKDTFVGAHSDKKHSLVLY